MNRHWPEGCKLRNLTGMCMAGETGGPGGTFPSGPHKFHFLGGTREDPVYNENGPLLLLFDCFSAITIVV